MTITATQDQNVATIKINSEQFDHNMHQEFFKICKSLKGANYIVDLAGVKYMDSSAFGSLLLLRKQAGDKLDAVALRNCGQAITKTLKIMNYHKLFNCDFE